jgi:tetratricopeptide (TPR) repeat protein
MHCSKLKSFLAACAACLCWLSAPVRSADDLIEVSVKVLDEAGMPIPYAAVWSAIEYDRKHVRDSDAYKTLSVDDLWRATLRYGALHDIVAQYGEKPVDTIRIPVMADADGIFRETLDYEEATGKDNHYARPDPLSFGYTFMKRGYLPGRVGFNIPRSQNRVEATVTLRRNPAEALATQTYLQTFARLRYELSDTRRDSELTEENRQRVASLQEQMERVAQQALAAGDKPAAARIYSRMRYLPAVHVVDGRIAGWNHGDGGSEEAQQALDKAYELAPEDLYVWMQTYLRRQSLLPTPTMEERVAASLRELDLLIAAKGEAVWPHYFLQQAQSHALLGHYETAYRIYREAAKREPKYMDWNEEIRKLKAAMKDHGMPVPAD